MHTSFLLVMSQQQRQVPFSPIESLTICTSDVSGNQETLAFHFVCLSCKESVLWDNTSLIKRRFMEACRDKCLCAHCYNKQHPKEFQALSEKYDEESLPIFLSLLDLLKEREEFSEQWSSLNGKLIESIVTFPTASDRLFLKYSHPYTNSNNNKTHNEF